MLYLLQDHDLVQYLPVVQEREQYFKWFIVTCTEQFFRYYNILFSRGKYSALQLLEHSSTLSSCMALYKYTNDIMLNVLAVVRPG